MARYSNRQWVTFLLLALAEFFCAVCFSLQAPFYPFEAESKGALPSQYGFVFGVFELAIFVCSPIFGAYMDKLGLKYVTCSGMFIVSFSVIAFGFLDKVQNTVDFLIFSFLIRIVEGASTAAYTVAIFSITAKEFTECIGTTFAILEGFFGVGLILGPTIGGALYEIGGFILPFFTVGIFTLVAAFLMICILPSNFDEDVTVNQGPKGMLNLIKNSKIFLGFLSIVIAAYALGVVLATLEPHVRPLNLRPVQVGCLFIVSGSTYALTSPIWGKIADKCFQPRLVQAIGSFLLVISFSLMGPAPYFPFEMSLPLIIAALVFQGLGMGAIFVGGFAGFHKDALALGYPDDISTSGYISGIWTAAHALGTFIGPSAAGILFDLIGFRWSTQTVVFSNAIMLIISLIVICRTKNKGLSFRDYRSSYGSILELEHKVFTDKLNIPADILEN